MEKTSISVTSIREFELVNAGKLYSKIGYLADK